MFNKSNTSFMVKWAVCICFVAAWLPAHVNAILNGENATIDMFPEAVQLVQRDNRTFECAGFLATDRHVVTAAHCVVKDGVAINLKVIANSTYTMKGGIERDVEAYYIPHDFKILTHNWDVAVIKLKEPLPLGKGIKVATMAGKPWGKQEILRITGWGVTEVGGPTSERLMMAHVRTISDHKCNERLHNLKNKHGQNVYENFVFTHTMSCALAKGHVDICSGDSGGPVYIDSVVYGIATFNMGCGRGKRPSIYTSIAKTRKFINATLCYKVSDVEVKNLKVFIPDLLCDAVPDMDEKLFNVYIPK